MQPPERDQQKGHGSNSQQHENSFQHDESSSALARGYTLLENCHEDRSLRKGLNGRG